MTSSPKTHPLLEVAGQLLPGEHGVLVEVDLLEHVDGDGAVLGVEELDVEVEGGAAGDDVAGALVAVAELRGHDQLALLAHAHAEDALLPALDHLRSGEREK